MSTSTTTPSAPPRDSRPRGQASSSSSAVGPPVPKPPTNIHPTAHLDPAAYVQGSHAIFLGAGSLVHPRARLVSAHGPLIIGDGVVISEKCVIGAPAPDPKEVAVPSSHDPLKTVVGNNVMIHPAAEIDAGVMIRDACVIESRTKILKGVTVGSHSKICGGCIVDRDIQDWEVIWGDGQQRRLRVAVDEVEAGRLKALEREREATGAIMRAATKATLLKKRG